jgi:hypothetical protein
MSDRQNTTACRADQERLAGIPDHSGNDLDGNSARQCAPPKVGWATPTLSNGPSPVQA